MRKNNRSIFLLILLLFVFFLFSNYKKRELNKKEIVEDKTKEFEIVENPKKPLYGEWKFEVIEDLTIGESDYKSSFFINPWRWEVKIDGEKNIYVLDSEECKVLKFNGNGKLILSIGKKGEGPGEFSRPGPWFVEENQAVWVYDSNEQKLIKFNALGKLLKELKIKSQLWDFYVDEKGRIFGLISDWSDKRKITSLVRFSSEGKLEKKLIETPEELSTHLVSKGVISFSHPYLFNTFFSYVEGNVFVCGYSSEYKLIFIDSEGNIIRIITKKENKVPVGKDIREEVLSWFNIAPQLKKNIAFAPYIPFFGGILTDNEGRIFVKRLPVSSKEFRFTFFDIFSKKGGFIYRAVLNFEPSIIDDGYMYNIGFYEEKDRYILKRYRVKNWKRFRRE